MQPSGYFVIGVVVGVEGVGYRTGSVDSAKVGFDSSDAVSSLHFCLFDAGLDRT